MAGLREHERADPNAVDDHSAVCGNTKKKRRTGTTSAAIIGIDAGTTAAHSAVSGNTKKIRRTSTTLAAIISIDASTTLRVADRPTPWVPCEVCMPI